MNEPSSPAASQPVAWLWRLLGEQRTGIVCSFVSAALMGMGSLIMDSSPQLYAGLSMDDVRFFFQPWRWQHAWFYALAVSLAIWALSALVCTWDSLVSRIQRRVTRPSAYGALVLHVTFVLALVAHLWGGLKASSTRFMVTAQGTSIDGETWRAVGFEQQTHSGGMPRSVTVTLQRSGEEITIGYNHPITSGAGARELLLGQVEMMADGLVVRHKGRQVVVRPDEPAVAGGDRIVLRRFHDPRRTPSLRVPVAELVIGGQSAMLPMDPQSTGETSFLAVNESPIVVLIQRRNPSVPLVLFVTLLLAVGVGLVAWERA
ncbi:MAG: hypothetical protein HY898_06655 [Deltaproteobacteria bacterium]|nr:hypothetical protein [Deltaproteobacteria bacterium]